MVAEQKRVSRLGSKEPAHPKVSPFRPTIEKGDEKVHKNRQAILLWINGLLKPTGNVGQRAHINFIQRFSQFYKALKSIQLDSPNVIALSL
jgi:hypothetical protein